MMCMLTNFGTSRCWLITTAARINALSRLTSAEESSTARSFAHAIRAQAIFLQIAALACTYPILNNKSVLHVHQLFFCTLFE